MIIRTDGLRAAGIPFERLVEGIDEQMGIQSGSSGGSSAADSAAAGSNGPTLARPAPIFDADKFECLEINNNEFGEKRIRRKFEDQADFHEGCTKNQV